eukprot:6182073-Lingulodinium_polyedra.AAC.1
MFQKLRFDPPANFNPDKHVWEGSTKKTESYLSLVDRDIYHMNWVEMHDAPITIAPNSLY